MRAHERERLSYSPQLEYVKELILSEGLAESIPPDIQAALNHPPTATRDLAVRLAKDMGELVSAIEAKLRAMEGFETYKAALDEAAQEDLSPWETGPDRADVLLYRTLRRTHESLSAVASVLEAVVEDTPEDEARKLERWIRSESHKDAIRRELARLEPLLVDGSPGKADQRYAELSGELGRLEHETAERRRDLALGLAPAFSPGLIKTESMMPRMYDLVYGTLAHDIQGDPAPLLKAFLDIIGPHFPSFSELRRILSTVRQALRFLASIRAVTARKAVHLFASYIQKPAWGMLGPIVKEVKRLQREIFWPLFAILELLAEANPKSEGPDPELQGLDEFSRQLLQVMKAIFDGFDELVEEAKRYSRFAVKHLESSLDEIQKLKQLEGFARMLDEALAELERFPMDLSQESHRSRFVQIVAESRGWSRSRDLQAEPGRPQDQEKGVDDA